MQIYLRWIEQQQKKNNKAFYFNGILNNEGKSVKQGEKWCLENGSWKLIINSHPTQNVETPDKMLIDSLMFNYHVRFGFLPSLVMNSIQERIATRFEYRIILIIYHHLVNIKIMLMFSIPSHLKRHRIVNAITNRKLKTFQGITVVFGVNMKNQCIK